MLTVLVVFDANGLKKAHHVSVDEALEECARVLDEKRQDQHRRYLADLVGQCSEIAAQLGTLSAVDWRNQRVKLLRLMMAWNDSAELMTELEPSDEEEWD